MSILLASYRSAASRRRVHTLAAAALLLPLAFAAPAFAQKTGLPRMTQYPDAQVSMGRQDRYPTAIEFRNDHKPTLAIFLDDFRTSFAMKPDDALKPVAVTRDELGFTQHRYQQTYRGIEVVGGEYIVQEKDGRVQSAVGRLAPELNLDPLPRTKEAQALKRALEHVGATTYMWEDPVWEKELHEKAGRNDTSYFPKGVLCWVPNVLGNGAQSNYRLCWRFDIHSSSPNAVKRVFVDARTGAIVNELPLESNCNAASFSSIFNGSRTISTDKYTATNFRLRDDCQSAAIRIRDWNSTTTTASPLEIENTTNTWTTNNERFGASVLWETKLAYQYYLTVHGRQSYDNANGSVEGYINAIFACNPPPNPCYYPDNASMSFSGGTMKVGLGSSGTLANSWSSLDIIAHEYTHAVTGSSSGLTYANESGALNESFSDIFGEVIENYGLGSNDWLMGDERTNGAIRSMANPKLYGNPDTYLGTNWYSGTNDNGGVHTNSGVQNKWFYLLTQGGAGTNDNGWAYSMSGIGLAAARAIAFRNLTVKLTSGSTYNDARTGAIASATDLYGNPSTERSAVYKAWRAVGIDPCVLTCPANITVSNDPGQCGAVVTFAATTTSGDCDVVSTVPASGSFFPVGTTTVTSTSTSGATCSFTVTVNDTQNPTVTCPANITVSNDPGQCSAVVTFADPVVSDNCPGVTVASVPPSGTAFPVGTTTVTSTATDNAGNTTSCSFTVTVNDTEPPTIAVTLSPTSLWPPNHTLKNITATVNVTDNCPNPTYVLTSITSNESDNGLGDGDVSNDIQAAAFGTADLAFNVRAERSGTGSGRVYTVRYTVTDNSGNTAYSDATVTVPRFSKDAIVAQAPAQFQLEQNYPNPFNPSTVIRFGIPSTATVSLRMYDILGHEVMTLIGDELRSAGTYEIRVDGSSLGTGLYTYRLTAASSDAQVHFTDSKTMILLK